MTSYNPILKANASKRKKKGYTYIKHDQEIHGQYNMLNFEIIAPNLKSNFINKILKKVHIHKA